MSVSIYKGLHWLCAPTDVRGSCKTILSSTEDCSNALVAVANQALSDTQLTYVASVLNRVRENGMPLGGLTPFRLGVVGSGMLELIGPALQATALRFGILLDYVICDFAQGVTQALDPASKINTAACDGFLLCFDYRGLPLTGAIMEPGDANPGVADSFALLEQMCLTLRQLNPNAHILVQTIAAPPETLFGSFDKRENGTLQHLIDELNHRIVNKLTVGACTLFDVAAVAQTVGLADWHSPTQWNMAKLPFAMEYLPLYCDHVCRLVAALKGKSKRVLVLDLDNTLWGGVIGDDGLGGIKLGEGDGTGEAFLTVQKLALAYRDRGIVLAVASKNTDSIARSAFREHPDMVLREEHIAVFQANWNDKPTNLKAIADELSLGLDAFVFLDDNPAERAIVRQFLPQVAVPELPEDPAQYARVLSAAGYFEATVFSAEDRKRASYYEANAKRAILGQSVTNMEQYLSALEMEIDLRPFDAVNRSRIYQLISKSNQFNLTTKRYSEAEVASLETAEDVFTVQVRLKDRFGDNGMISVVICRMTAAKTWTIDSWLMSCRVLGRGVERVVLDHIATAARERGGERLIGQFKPTKRNDLVRDHYANLGFSPSGTESDGSSFWIMQTSAEISMPPMKRSPAHYGIPIHS